MGGFGHLGASRPAVQRSRDDHYIAVTGSCCITGRKLHGALCSTATAGPPRLPAIRSSTTMTAGAGDGRRLRALLPKESAQQSRNCRSGDQQARGGNADQHNSRHQQQRPRQRRADQQQRDYDAERSRPCDPNVHDAVGAGSYPNLSEYVSRSLGGMISGSTRRDSAAGVGCCRITMLTTTPRYMWVEGALMQMDRPIATQLLALRRPLAR